MTKIIHGFVIRKYAKMTSSAELSETLAEGNGDNHYNANYVQVAPLGTWQSLQTLNKEYVSRVEPMLDSIKD